MKHWLRDQHFRSLLRNTSYLAVSRGVAAVASLATLSLTAHGLGVLLFGSLILITSYAKAASGLSKFQTWQLIVRYGGKAIHEGRVEEFQASAGFAVALDALSGILGMIAAIALLPVVGRWVGIQQDQLWLAAFYCTLMPTLASATPTGILRALDRFDLISWQGTVSPISRVVLIGLAYSAHAPFYAYVIAWYATDLIADIYFWYLAGRELHRRGLLKGIRATFRPHLLPGAWRFAIHVNLTSSVQSAWGPVARLVVGGLLGPAGAALFRVASSLSDSAAKPADLLANAFYPEIIRMDLATRKPWKLMLRGTALASAVALVAILILLIGGKPLIGVLFGKDFLGAYDALLILMLVPFLSVFSFPMPAMLYALDRPDAPLKGRLVGTLLFFAIIAPLSWSLGVIGAATAFVIGNAAMVAVLMLQLFGEYRRLRARPA